jgi:thioredoxin-like negative regulator of GroEL
MSADQPISTTDIQEDEQGEEIDDDFLYHLYQGGELLQAGRMLDAKEHLEKAFTLKPTNPRGQNLLGLVYFKMGVLPRAIDIYRNLIDRFGEDVTLRVNLGMVYIKAGMLNEAEEQLRRAIELKPDHEKARRYLGLVLSKKGRVEETRTQLDKINIQNADSETDLGIDELPQQQKPRSVMQGAVAEVAEQGYRELDEKEYPFQPVSDMASPIATEKSSLEETWHTTEPIIEYPGVAKEEAVTFRLDGDALVVRSTGRIFTRLQGIFSVDGDLKFLPLNKRFKGEITRHSFDKGSRAMMQVDGSGRLLIYPVEHSRFYIHHQDKEPSYFQEDQVFAFSDTAPWENGVLPAENAEGLRIFHLMGSADLVFLSVGSVRFRKLENDGRIMLLANRLVGWAGPLVPRLLQANPLLPEGLWIELKGMGTVFYLI